MKNQTNYKQPQTKSVNPYFPNENETKALKYILDMKFMKVSQVQQKFELGVESLVLRGYLTSKDQTLTSDSLVRISDQGYTYLKARNPDAQLAEPLKAIWSPRINHDLSLVDIRMKFEDLNFITKWYSDQMLRESGFMKRTFVDLPDAVCRKTDGKSYFLELEISGKSKKEYEDRIDLYSRVLETEDVKSQGIEGLIFLCTDEKVLETIREKLPEGDRRFSALHISRYIPEYAGHKPGKPEIQVDTIKKVAPSKPTNMAAPKEEPKKGFQAKVASYISRATAGSLGAGQGNNSNPYVKPYVPKAAFVAPKAALGSEPRGQVFKTATSQTRKGSYAKAN